MNQPLPPTGEDRVFAPPPTPLAPLQGQGRAVVVIAVGGALGALSRWAVGLALPTRAGAFPLGTFAINVVGCFLIGALIVAVTEITDAHPLIRPFVATGFLGGFTTFSTYSVDGENLLLGGHVGQAVGYLLGTLAAAIAATWAGITLTRAIGVRRRVSR